MSMLDFKGIPNVLTGGAQGIGGGGNAFSMFGPQKSENGNQIKNALSAFHRGFDPEGYSRKLEIDQQEQQARIGQMDAQKTMKTETAQAGLALTDHLANMPEQSRMQFVQDNWDRISGAFLPGQNVPFEQVSGMLRPEMFSDDALGQQRAALMISMGQGPALSADERAQREHIRATYGDRALQSYITNPEEFGERMGSMVGMETINNQRVQAGQTGDYRDPMNVSPENRVLSPNGTQQLTGPDQGYVERETRGLDQTDFSNQTARINAQTARMGAGLEKQKFEQALTEYADKRSGAGPVDTDTEQKLRKEFTALTSDYRAIRDAYARIRASGNNPTPAGDMALIFNYMKMLDPGSVVRESEFELAASTGSYGERVQGLVNKIMSGERLPPAVRADFMSRSDALYQEQEAIYGDVESKYRGIAEASRLNPNRTVPDLRGGVVAESGVPQPGAIEDGYRFKGGNPADPANWERQ